jgi:signal transduction histidine kinase
MADHLQEEIEAVTRSRDRLETILGSMVEGVLVTDGTGRITMTNEALSAMLSIKADPVGRMPSEILRNAVLIEAFSRYSTQSLCFDRNPHPGRAATDLQLDVVPLSGRGVAGEWWRFP